MAINFSEKEMEFCCPNLIKMEGTMKTIRKALQIILPFSILILAFVFAQCSRLPTESQTTQREPELLVKVNNRLPNSEDRVTNTTGGCEFGTQRSGANYQICLPTSPPQPSWNGDLVVYAHGYVSIDKPLVPQDDKVGGIPISQIITGMGFGFATTSYYKNGLVEPKIGIKDLVKLVKIFGKQHGEPNRTYLIGVSEGGLITTLAIEKRPDENDEEEEDVFNGGLALCGPIGDFREQINYFGNFRVVFDYFFPGVISGSPVNIPQAVMEAWDDPNPLNNLQLAIIAAISAPANQLKTAQLLTVTGAAFDPNDPLTIGNTVLGILFYNILGTNDAIATLGGQPFDNQQTTYSGSLNDMALKGGIERFSADRAAINRIESHYQTSGQPMVPLFTMHTDLDEIVPSFHETLYRLKVIQTGSTALHTNIPEINRYGHCNFELAELLNAFGQLIFKVTGQPQMIAEAGTF